MAKIVKRNGRVITKATADSEERRARAEKAAQAQAERERKAREAELKKAEKAKKKKVAEVDAVAGGAKAPETPKTPKPKKKSLFAKIRESIGRIAKKKVAVAENAAADAEETPAEPATPTKSRKQIRADKRAAAEAAARQKIEEDLRKGWISRDEATGVETGMVKPLANGKNYLVFDGQYYCIADSKGSVKKSGIYSKVLGLTEGHEIFGSSYKKVDVESVDGEGNPIVGGDGKVVTHKEPEYVFGLLVQDVVDKKGNPVMVDTSVIGKDGKPVQAPKKVYGVIRSDGEVLVKPKYDGISYFSTYKGREGGNLALVEKDGKYGLIDETGNEVYSCTASDYIIDPENGLITFKEEYIPKGAKKPSTRWTVYDPKTLAKKQTFNDMRVYETDENGDPTKAVVVRTGEKEVTEIQKDPETGVTKTVTRKVQIPVYSIWDLKTGTVTGKSEVPYEEHSIEGSEGLVLYKFDKWQDDADASKIQKMYRLKGKYVPDCQALCVPDAKAKGKMKTVVVGKEIEVLDNPELGGKIIRVAGEHGEAGELTHKIGFFDTATGGYKEIGSYRDGEEVELGTITKNDKGELVGMGLLRRDGKIVEVLPVGQEPIKMPEGVVEVKTLDTSFAVGVETGKKNADGSPRVLYGEVPASEERAAETCLPPVFKSATSMEAFVADPAAAVGRDNLDIGDFTPANFAALYKSSMTYITSGLDALEAEVQKLNQQIKDLPVSEDYDAQVAEIEAQIEQKWAAQEELKAKGQVVLDALAAREGTYVAIKGKGAAKAGATYTPEDYLKEIAAVDMEVAKSLGYKAPEGEAE